jgi:DNA-binding NarL/FixJ family response regulator
MAAVQRVVLVDDSPSLRFLARVALEDLPDTEVVGEAEDGLNGLAMIEKLKPDVAIVDIQMPGMTGVELIRILRSRHITTRLIAHSNDERGLADALVAGADSAVMKGPALQSLAMALAS